MAEKGGKREGGRRESYSIQSKHKEERERREGEILWGDHTPSDLASRLKETNFQTRRNSICYDARIYFVRRPIVGYRVHFRYFLQVSCVYFIRATLICKVCRPKYHLTL